MIRLVFEGATMLTNVFSKFIYRTLFAAALSGLAIPAAKAAPLELFVATDYAMDYETGIKAPAALNLSGTANLSYINNGIVLSFEGRDGGVHTLKIHLDFDGLLNADPNSRAAAQAIYDAINKLGPSAVGKIMSDISQRAKTSGQVLTLMLDARSAGFYKTDYDLSQVRMVTSGGENVRLQNLVAAAFMPQQMSPSASQEQNEKPMEQAPANPRLGEPSPNGTTAASAVSADCEKLFINSI